ncbi:MAG TPA: phosphatidate cytidylyltransferase [Nevskiales bacterium]|nr:phosphatidate cytidylyltransferase [Nevskiales bacterium]
MLMQRVITALILIPPVVAAVWFLPTAAIAVALALLMLIGAWEWGQLMRLRAVPLRMGYVAVVAVLLLVLYGLREHADLQRGMLGLALLWWLLAFLWVLRYPAGLRTNQPRPWLVAGIGLLLLGPAFLALVLLHARLQGPLWILFLLALIWAADTGAYFSGRSFGHHKLAVRVSPGKTWEGAAGGLLLSATVAALAGHWLFDLDGRQLLLFVLLCAGVVVFSIVGDLTESMFKRHAGVKDSGTLFPGHGGVLDRLDSLFAAAPLFLGGLLVMGL